MTKRAIIFLAILLFIPRLQAAPVIDSIAIDQGTCRDNGIIRIFAHSATPLHYAIIAGPQVRPPQTSNTFTALQAGLYTVQISDASSSAMRTATITSSYQYFDFSTNTVSALCLRDTNMLLIASVDSNLGRGPLTWQLTDPAGVSYATQSSDTFHVPSGGTYTIRCTDACGTVRQRYISTYRLSNTDLQFQYNLGPYRVGCDSAHIYAEYTIPNGVALLPFPVTFVEYTNHDTFSYTMPTNPGSSIQNLGTGYLQLFPFTATFENTVGRVYPGDEIFFGFIDACGDTVINSATVPSPSLILNGFYSMPDSSCGSYSIPDIRQNLATPNQWVLIDDNTHQIVDSASGQYGMTPHPPNSDYTYICFDQCGDTLRQSFYWQAAQTYPVSVIPTITQNSCMDSTAAVSFLLSSFHAPITFRILSGPAYAHSSKAGFAYSSHITYPWVADQIAYSYLPFSGLPPGHYTFDAGDTCGHYISSSFDITPDQVTDFTHQVIAGQNCLGGSSIYYRYSTGLLSDNLVISYHIYNLTTGQLLDSDYTYGSNGNATLGNLDPGTYTIRLDITGGNMHVTDSSFCSENTDTVVIAPYSFPDMPVVTYSPSCTGYATITAQMDTTLGVPSYTYQIIDGPMLSAMQVDNGTFQVSQTGIYTILGLDACGNGLIRHISVDSLYRAVPMIRSFKDTCFHTYVRGVLYTESTVAYDTLRTAMGCDSIIYVDSVVIRGSHDRRPIIALATDTFCAGAGGDVSAIAGYHLYQWDNGATTPIIHVSDSGWYHLIVTDSEHCTLSDQIYIALLDSPSVVSGWIYADSVCMDDPLQVGLTLSGPDVHYEWSDIANGTLQRQFVDSGIYTFTVSNKCAAKSYTLHTTEKTCDEHAYPPNAFSPNGDGINDIYRIYSSYDFKSFSLLIFDRWGEKVFESNNEANGWDGRYKNEDLPTGVYVYEYIGVWPTGHSHTSRGSITLIR